MTRQALCCPLSPLKSVLKIGRPFYVRPKLTAMVGFISHPIETKPSITSNSHLLDSIRFGLSCNWTRRRTRPSWSSCRLRHNCLQWLLQNRDYTNYGPALGQRDSEAGWTLTE